ncbi:MAG: idi [Bacteroidota bacterium]|nr:idi [Bacteroidota bacterium]
MDKLEKISSTDPTAAERKQDHIQLAFDSQVESLHLDKRFSYEPLLSAHPDKNLKPVSFLNRSLKIPVWVSSMTGGTEKAFTINSNLARACKAFGMGMGLGSCRALLESDDRLKDFDFRKIIGDDLPFYANIGIAQLEMLLKDNELFKLDQLIDKLQADGIIIHVNPLQEWLQPEGDKITVAPIITLQKFLDKTKQKVIVKEVGQGIGKESLRALMKLPVEVIEFAAHGGTNFSKLELLRGDKQKLEVFKEISRIGHSAEEMTAFVNEINEEEGNAVLCKQFIISGGVKDFLDGYYLMKKLNATAVYGQASTLLQYAEKSYEDLEQFLYYQVEGLKLVDAFFKVR